MQKTKSKVPLPRMQGHVRDHLRPHCSSGYKSFRCHFRHSKNYCRKSNCSCLAQAILPYLGRDNYGTFLSQALASIVDLVGEDMEDGTVGTCWRGVSAVKAAPFAISKNAKRKFGVVATTRETRRSRTNGFKAAPAALQQRVVDEQEEQRKVWEKHERQPEAQVTRSRHWRQISIIATRSTCLVPLHQL